MASLSDPRPEKSPAPPALKGFALMDTCRFRLCTVEEAEIVSHCAAAMFRDPARIRPGLHALLLNAVEHGCLGIGHELKDRIVREGIWGEEVARRQSLPENRKKSVELVLSRKSDGVFAVITDPGPGFDWQTWLTVDPARAGNVTGRGIAWSRSASFDGLSYNAQGNQAVAHARDARGMEW